MDAGTATAHDVPARPDWQVRAGTLEDVPAVVAAVSDLVVELGGRPPERSAAETSARELIEDPHLGCVIVAADREAIVGVLAASWQTAIHAAGPYALIQDLWVRSDRRSGEVGSQLVEALISHVKSLGMRRIEVGLPSESFAALAATEAFYSKNEFELLGPRMRRLIG